MKKNATAANLRSNTAKRQQVRDLGKNRVMPEWNACSTLFPPLKPELAANLSHFYEILQKIRPLKPAHRANLAKDIRNLSSRLTDNRASLNLPYWSDPASVSAYLYYFLPWNILRLCRLLSSLDLPLPPTGSSPILLDAGSGPLTLPIALWLARPDLRSMPLRIIALDSARQPMELGKRIFCELPSSWRVSLINSPVETLAEKASAIMEGKPWLISCVNVLNELASRSLTKHKGDQLADSGAKAGLPNLYQRLLSAWMPLLRQEARPALLFVEPGTRLGGNLIMNMRKAIQEAGMEVSAPCAHNGECPLLNSARRNGSLTSQWCHFSFLPTGAPKWLTDLSHEAGLEKQSLSLSLLLAHGKSIKKPATGLAVRVLSRPMPIENLAGEARYACSEEGMAILENSRNLPSGALAMATQPDRKKLDARHGYPILSPLSESGPCHS